MREIIKNESISKQRNKMNFLFVALFALIAAYASAGTLQTDGLNSTLTGTCGGNCPGNDCSSCPCGSTKKSIDIGAWCAKKGWNQVSCANSV
jgi:hypothetical protein